MSEAESKTMKAALVAYITFLIVLTVIDIYFKRRMEARFQEGLEAYYERIQDHGPPNAPAPTAYAPPAQAPAAYVPVPAAEPQTFPVVEDIVPTAAQVPVQNGAAPTAEPAVVAGRPVTEGQLEGPLV